MSWGRGERIIEVPRMNDSDWTALRQAEDTDCLKADLCLCSPKWWRDVLVGEGDPLHRELEAIWQEAGGMRAGLDQVPALPHGLLVRPCERQPLVYHLCAACRL